ncbi:MAG TPA: hypothetical protein VMH91_02700 [Candidatus Paceibacterota bacterium]|nr:hypothetical protein [Candidatus Paceibacterota bacterium]
MEAAPFPDAAANAVAGTLINKSESAPETANVAMRLFTAPIVVVLISLGDVLWLMINNQSENTQFPGREVTKSWAHPTTGPYAVTS